MSESDKNGGTSDRLWLRLPISRESILILFAVLGTCIATVARIGAYFQEIRDQIGYEAQQRKEADEHLERDEEREWKTMNEKMDAMIAQHHEIINRTQPRP